MSNEARNAISKLTDGKAYTLKDNDWDLVADFVGVDLAEYDEYDYEDYILGRVHQTTFIQGDVSVDGSCRAEDLLAGREGYEPPDEYHEMGIVILGDLEVTGNLELDELSPLFVSGDVKAGTITNTYGTLVSGGAVEAEFVYVISADEGGMVHASECKTRLFIDGSGNLDYHAPGDYPLLLANHYSPRQRYTLQKSLEELGFNPTGTTFSSELRSLGEEQDTTRFNKLIELVEQYRDVMPDNVPEAAKWSDGYPPCYMLQETGDDGQPHGIHGQWKADGTIEFLKRYKRGKAHGEWIVEREGKLFTQHFVDGELERPDGVPEDALWKQDDWQWELSPKDENGQKHGLVRWWRADGTLLGETPYEHGVAQGEGRRYHESGEISQSYTFVDGKLHGERTWYATKNPTTEEGTSHCGEGVAKLVFVYDMGEAGSPKYYDHDGNEVDHTGERLE